MSSGVPISRSSAAIFAVRSGPYELIPTYSALPDTTAWCRAPAVSSSGVSGSGRWL